MLALVAWLAHAPMLRALGGWVVVDGVMPETRADFIYLLNGDVHTRPFHAAALYQAGVAPLVVVPMEEDRPATAIGLEESDTRIAVKVLKRLGVPGEAIRVLRMEGGVTSTFDEARVLATYLRDHPADTVVAVTTHYHTRRARWVLRGAAARTRTTVLMAAAPDERYDADAWWTNEFGLVHFVQEYLKWGHYWMSYR